MAVIKLNFKGAPAAQGGGGLGDHVPPGGYLLTINKNTMVKTQSGKDMIVMEYRTAENKRITENFVIPREGTDDSKFPLQRFHALLNSVGVPDLTDAGDQNFDLDQMNGKQFVGDVVDEEIPAKDNYPARSTSRPNGYYALTSDEAKRLMDVAKPATVTPAADAPAAAAATAEPAAAVATAVEPAVEPAAQPEQPAVAPQTVATEQPAPAATPSDDSVEQRLNDMFTS